MNDYTPKPDTGTLLVNGFKKNEAQPDFTGTYATSDGTIRQIAAWMNENNGRQYISLRFSDPYVADES